MFVLCGRCCVCTDCLVYIIGESCYLFTTIHVCQQLSTYEEQVAVLSHQRGHKESLGCSCLGEPDYILHK
jgi:hypothetical protein